eukprot:TRINITY_DN34237_c0_g1_i1.p1 TRINITY_DN34237_c0_g1~~TRINITY_DN34237_c0_g1_i1.p1  ORF type:complete len:615 (-),score=174.95 TRINITY_DN34237_c0_g1_i1:46-1890(-)
MSFKLSTAMAVLATLFIEGNASAHLQLGLLELPPSAILGQVDRTEKETWQAVNLLEVVVLALVIVAGLAYCLFPSTSTSTSKTGEPKESPSPEAGSSSNADVASASSREASADFEALLKTGLKVAAQKFGPKLSKAHSVKTIVESKLWGFPGKAKALLIDELAGALGTFLSAVEAEEAMLLLDLDKAVAANFPPMATLLAGILSPTLLGVAMAVAMAQLYIVIIPVVALSSWALWEDYAAICSIPSMLLWTKAQLGIGVFLGTANAVLAYKIGAGKRALNAKTESMQARLAAVQAKGTKELDADELRELFVCNSVLVEEALRLEDEVKGSVWHHAVGVGTTAWVLMIVWTFVLVFGWTFVPGVVAFSEESKLSSNYCGAWASVLTARLTCALSLLFLVVNLLVLAHWLCTLMIRSQSFASAVLHKARDIDSRGIGLPVAELFAKAFLLRGSPDTYGAQLAVANAEKAHLEAQRTELAKRIAELDGQINTSSSAVATLQADVGEDEAVASAALASTQAEEVAEKSLEEAQREAAELAAVGYEELTKLLERFMGLAEQLQDSEAYKAAIAKAQDLAQTDLQTAAREAAQQAGAAAEKLKQSEMMSAATAKAQEVLK